MTTIDLRQAFENMLKEIRDFVYDGNFVFRGESKVYKDISSNLYREYEKAAGTVGFSIDIVQSRILESVKKHIKEESDDAILEQLQHYGGKTNQIDFTTDYLIALFFACEAEPEKDGRLIFLKRDMLNTQVGFYEPDAPRNRVVVQKSIFVRSSSGVVEADKIIIIDNKLKAFILSYLDRYHSINVENIYHDIHGFIYRNRNYEDSYTHFHLGLAYSQEEKHEEAIKHYTKALEYDNSHPFIYNCRGNAYSESDEHDLAIADYNKTIELNPNYILAYNSLGITYVHKGNLDLAIDEFNKVIEINPDYADAYINRGNAYIKKGEYSLALADCNKAIIELNSNDAKAYGNRGVAKKILKDLKGAREDLETALQLAEQKGDKDYADIIQKEIAELAELEK